MAEAPERMYTVVDGELVEYVRADLVCWTCGGSVVVPDTGGDA